MCFQVSPLSATRLALLVDERKSREETNLEFSTTAASDKDESLPKDHLMINIPIMQPAKYSQIGKTVDSAQDQLCSLRLKAGQINQPKLRNCENVGGREEAGIVGEIVSKRMALFRCENDAKMSHSQSSDYEGPTQMRMSHSRSAGSKPFEKPGRFEMLI